MRLYALLLGALAALGLSGVVLAGPFLPGMKGLTRAEPGLWIDHAATTAQQAQIKALIAQARAKAAQALGPLRSAPEWQVCVTADCDAALGLVPRGLTWYDRVIQIGSRAALDGRFYLHETVHAELHNAAGLIGAVNAALPNWLDEGAAVLISHTPGHPGRDGDCASVANIAPPMTGQDFAQLAGPKGETATRAYLVTACATQDWLAHGNDLSRLTARLRVGEELR